TNHPVPCFAMRIEADGKTLVYTADSSFKEEFISFSKKADVLLCECNFYGHQNGKGAGHMTSLEAGMLADKAGVNHLILTHLPNYGDLVDLVQEASQNFEGAITLAKQFLCVEL
ncbi:MAG: MBL fold metallo-hydrolase, partial [Bacillota bacterium]|nr:MBL fold metallo-hydrolase [Bacillota bacterium]